MNLQKKWKKLCTLILTVIILMALMLPTIVLADDGDHPPVEDPPPAEEPIPPAEEQPPPAEEAPPAEEEPPLAHGEDERSCIPSTSRSSRQ